MVQSLYSLGLKRYQFIWYILIIGLFTWNLTWSYNRWKLLTNVSHKTMNLNSTRDGNASSDEHRGSSDDLSTTYSTERHIDMYLTQPHLAKENEQTIIAFVLSTADHYERRILIRKTWANSAYYNLPNGTASLSTIFAVGLMHDEAVNSCVRNESKAYGDILLMNNIDAYSNLVTKVKLALAWIHRYSNAAYVLKVDDDVVLNPFGWIKMAERLAALDMSCFVLGVVRVDTKPRRFGKYGVTDEDFEDDFYPNYCNGPGYMLARDSVAIVLKGCSRTPFFTMEDVYFTGILVAQTPIHHLALPQSAFVDLPKPWKINDTGAILERIRNGLMAHRVPANLWLSIWHVYETERRKTVKISLDDVTERRNNILPLRWRLKPDYNVRCVFNSSSLADCC